MQNDECGRMSERKHEPDGPVPAEGGRRASLILDSPLLFLLPSAVILGLFLVYPVLWSCLASFRRIGIGDLLGVRLWTVPGKWIGLENYRSIFTDPAFWRSLANTAYFAILFIPGTLIASLGMALLVRQSLRGIGAFRALFFLPYVVSIVAAGLVWRWMFDTEHGLINAVIAAVGGNGPDWLGTPELAMLVIALMCIWRWSGYFMLVFLAGLEAIPSSLYEAADVDGAGWWMTFHRVTLPLLRRPMIFALIVLLIRAQNIFQEVYVMTGGGPGNSTVTVAFLIWQTAFRSFLIGRGAALSYLLFLFVLAAAVAQFILLGRERRR